MNRRDASLRALVCVVLADSAGCSYRNVDAIVARDTAAPSLPTSCMELLARATSAPDGLQTIDPDGPGGAPPREVFCDMSSDGGGWTRVALELFAQPPTGFSRNTVTTCGTFGAILGGYQTFGNERVSKTFDLLGVPHREVRVTFAFLVIDSWDHERAFLELDGRRIWQKSCDKGAPETCNQSGQVCGRMIADTNDGRLGVSALAPHTAPTATLSFGAELDQTDENWGVDDLAVFVR